jgi:hypothetical protein
MKEVICLVSYHVIYHDNTSETVTSYCAKFSIDDATPLNRDTIANYLKSTLINAKEVEVLSDNYFTSEEEYMDYLIYIYR